MPKGGRLTITCAPLPNQRVRVRVEDTGVGIAPENLTKIFELYYTTKERGTGVGLSMVYRTIQIHNGEIDVESTAGVGTTFIVVPCPRRPWPLNLTMMANADYNDDARLGSLVLLTASLVACAAKAQVRTETEIPLLDPPPPPPRVVADLHAGAGADSPHSRRRAGIAGASAVAARAARAET